MGRQFTVVQVGCQRHESVGSEPGGHLLDATVETPPLLDHEHPGTGAASGPDQVAGCIGAIAREGNCFSHGANVALPEFCSDAEVLDNLPR